MLRRKGNATFSHEKAFIPTKSTMHQSFETLGPPPSPPPPSLLGDDWCIHLYASESMSMGPKWMVNLLAFIHPHTQYFICQLAAIVTHVKPPMKVSNESMSHPNPNPSLSHATYKTRFLSWVPCIFSLLRFSKTCELWSLQLRFLLPSIIQCNYDHKQQTLKHRNTQMDQTPPISNHKPWPIEPVEVNFCLLRGLLRWSTAAKRANVSWLLNFRICMFMKSAINQICFSLHTSDAASSHQAAHPSLPPFSLFIS